MNPCCFCQQGDGNLVGLVNYFDIAHLDMIQCVRCGLISVDPIPASEVVTEGCLRLYASGYGNGRRGKVLRGFAKSYRKGAAFARRYLSEAVEENVPIQILEVGAGDGYFSAGIRGEIPKAKVWLLDIVEDLARYYARHHECIPVADEFDSNLFEPGQFDLIIFRDLLEHVRDPFQFLSEASRVVAPGGQIFFVTPNGKEDFWMINQRFLKTGQRTVLLLNHFHYFLPDTLQKMLGQAAFSITCGFKFGLKQHRAGLGHKEFSSFDEQSVPRTDPKRMVNSVCDGWSHDPTEVVNRFLSDLGPLSRVYSRLVDTEKGIVPFSSPIGHEFFVIAKKVG
jgi:SAM-dependent methyltransferase